VTAVNGLSVIEQVVLRDRSVSFGDPVEALRDNLDVHGEIGPIGRISRIRQILLNAPKWGNDDDRADKWTEVWSEMRERTLREVEDEIGDKRHVVQHVIRSLHHIDGAKLGATPDGRLAGTPTADSIGPTVGTALEGPTALLNSVMKLRPSRYWQGGYNLNLTVSPALAADPHLRDNLLAMVEVFFAHGGQELQIGCLDADMLRDAKAHPEKYPHLLVRIAGFNALFAKLSSAEQNELIARARCSG
jgi:pyruvate-formate lyase